MIRVYPAPPPTGLPVGFASAPYIAFEGSSMMEEGVVAEARVKYVLPVSLTVGWLMLCTLTW
jgi:hypothetical protein